MSLSRGALSGSHASHEAPEGSSPVGFDPGRMECVSWALKTVNDMVTLGIIENTVQARSRHLNALFDVLLPKEQSQ